MRCRFHARRGSTETAILVGNADRADRAIGESHRVAKEARLSLFAQNRAFRPIGVETSGSLRYTFG